MVKIKAYAKINLTLEITGIKDGYHMLDSFVASLDLFDLVCLKKRKDNAVTLTMVGMNSENIPLESNNAYKACVAFRKKFSTAGADVTVYKNIPIGGGLGGSSADAAGVIAGMAKLYSISDEAALGELADRFGSDTRYMLKGGFCRMRGRGNLLGYPADGVKFPKLHFLLICPFSSVSSGACYKKYDELLLNEKRDINEKNAENHTEKCIAAFARGDVNEGGRYLTNALYAPAALLNPDVKKAYEEALSFSPSGVVMSGSGSTVAALFESEELCCWAKSRYNGEFSVYTVATV